MTYAACILWTILLAVWSAADDAEQIRNNERLNKALQWLARAFGVTAFCVACGMWWMALPMGALFSSVFRFTLNRLRWLDWRYVAPWSSFYDRVFYALATMYWWSDAHLRSHRILLREYWKSSIADGSDIHRAGLLAYIAELAFAVIIFVMFV